MKRYVLGFMFDNGESQEHNGEVALIQKTHPEWQAGMLNGIGGEIEEGELPFEAMVREFEEETGLRHLDWTQYTIMQGKDWIVYCFWANGDLTKLRTTTDEEIFLEHINDDDGHWLENVSMLVHMAWFMKHTKDRVIISITYS